MRWSSALCGVVWLGFATCGLAADQLQVSAPHSPTVVMIDGKLSPAEWKDAARIHVPGVANLYFKQAAGFVYIGVEYTSQPSGIVDLYLSADDGAVYDLHTSAKLGERELHAAQWPEWTWWNNRDWVANVSRVDSWDKRTFLPEPVREYQIRRSRFLGDVWRLRFELTAMAGQNQLSPATIFPAGTSDSNPRNWLALELK